MYQRNVWKCDQCADFLGAIQDFFGVVPSDDNDVCIPDHEAAPCPLTDQFKCEGRGKTRMLEQQTL